MNSCEATWGGESRLHCQRTAAKSVVRCFVVLWVTELMLLMATLKSINA